MRTIEVNLYQFDELPTDKAKERAREWYRRASDNDTYWSEATLEDAEQILTMLGFCAPKIMFSGFGSQGDGACFTGTWYAKDCKPEALKEHAPMDEKLHAIADEFARIVSAHPTIAATLTRRGHYYHEHSISFDIEAEDSEDATDDEALQEASRDLMRWIYRALESEWNYQNSDEQIDDNIRCNEYEFTVTGVRA